MGSSRRLVLALVGVLVFLAYAAAAAFVVAGLVALVLVTVLVRARSRQREFAADDRAVAVTGDPVALASTLRKIERATGPRGLFGSRYRPSSEDDVPRWLSTQPAVDERIERLRD